MKSTKRELFEKQENNLRELLGKTKLELESNIDQVAELGETLKMRQPVYEAHQEETEFNENLTEVNLGSSMDGIKNADFPSRTYLNNFHFQ